MGFLLTKMNKCHVQNRNANKETTIFRCHENERTEKKQKSFFPIRGTEARLSLPSKH